MVILVICRLAWGITNRGSTVNIYIIYIYYLLYIYIYLLRAYSRTRDLPNLPFTKITFS